MSESIAETKGSRIASWLLYLGLASIILIIYTPILLLIIFSFNSGRFPVFPLRRFTLQWYADMFRDPTFMTSLGNSVMVSLGASLTATVIGFFGAYSLSRSEFKGKEQLAAFLITPLAIPYILLGISLRIYFFRLGISLSLFTAFLGHLIFTIPLALLILRARFAQIPITYEEAAWDLGARRLRTLWEVIFPLSIPGILASIMLTFTFSFDEFVIAYFLTKFEMTLPIKIWTTLITGFDPRVNAIGTIVFVFTLTLAVTAQRFIIFSNRKGAKND